MKKETLYDRLLENFKQLGYEVEEDYWIENVGYKLPTKEYWIDVVVSKEKDRYKKTLHYFFGSNKNKIKSIECWETEYKLVEQDAIKLF